MSPFGIQGNQPKAADLPMVWPNSIRAVAFDLDGLLINTEELYLEVCQKLLDRWGKTYHAELRRQMMGLPGPLALQLMIDVENLDTTWQELQQASDDHFEAILTQRLRPMPGADELLGMLESKSIPRCVATSSRHVFARKVLGMLGWLERFQFIITAEDVPRGKPHPDIYLAAADRFQIAVNEMLVLEDSGHGARSGISSGACCIAVPGDHSRDQVFDGAWHVADSLHDATIRNLFATK